MERIPLQNWREILEELLKKIYQPLKESNYRWTIIGSVATALQGYEVTPKDIDIIVENPEAVYFISSLLTEYAPQESQEDPFSEGGKWLSSKKQSIFEGIDAYGYKWVFGRWEIKNADVEIAHITAPEGFLEAEDHDWIWEAGPEIWPYIHKVNYNSYEIPVVPLEIQLETNSSRNINDRVELIISFFKENGYDKELIKKSLCKKCYEKFEKMIIS